MESMKRLLIILLSLWGIAEAQPVPGYTYINQRVRYEAGAYNDLLIPAGGTASRGAGTWNRSGALMYDSTGTDTGLYVYHRPYWVKVSGSSQTLQQTYSLESNKAVMTATDTMLLSTNKYTIQGSSGTEVFDIDMTRLGGGGTPGPFRASAKNFAGTIFTVEGLDPGFVKAEVINYNTPTTSAAAGISYATTIVGVKFQNINNSGQTQIFKGGGQNFFCDSCTHVGDFGSGVKISASSTAGIIRFQVGSNTESGGVISRINSAGHWLINTSTDIGGKWLNVPNSVYFGDSLILSNLLTGSASDSVLVTSGGVTKRILQSSLVSGSTNTSIGSGYKVAVDATNNIKSLSAKYGIIIDSATTGEVGIKYDSATANTHIRASIAPTSLTVGTTAIANSNTRSLLYDSSGILKTHPLLLYNTSGELQLGATADAGAFILQVTGASNFTGAGTFGSLLTVNNTVLANAFQTSSTGANSNFFTSSTTGTSRSTGAPYLFKNGAGSASRIWINGTTATTQTAGDDYGQMIVGRGVFTEAGSGTHPRGFGLAVFGGTVTGGAAATDTLVGLYVDGPPTGITAGTGSWNSIYNFGDVLVKNGNLSLGTAGNKLSITTGTNASMGVSGAMTAGSITISTTAVTASSRIFLTHSTLGGTQGVLSVGTVTAGTSFVINSSSALDTGTVNWWIVN